MWTLVPFGDGGFLVSALTISLLKVAKVRVHRKKLEEMKKERVGPHHT